LEFSSVGQIFLRMIGIFLIALVVIRFMGNRTVGQYSPFDFVLMVGVGDIVGNVAMERTESLLIGVEALAGLFVLQQVLARLSLKSTFFRKWFEGTPVVLIQDGVILRENLKRSQFNYDDLRQELHKFGMDFSNLQDIKTARLESCGDFSLIKSSAAEPITKRDVEAFIQGLEDNPLSQMGMAWAKLDQLTINVEEITSYIKSHKLEPETQPQGSQLKDNLH